ncbi:hypothetical protein AWJ24_09215 [Escherichia coli]|nr:hypothetical protein AWJ24_09215 [Escherichia coli]OKV62568.1 hypothetical protein AWP57_25345 [Escherichia coli]OKV76668.1 hypothetical protein AWP64_27540 [Escherichia coli]OKV98467.1 hypothetical protein AWP65_14685 [Escherichia coli]OKW04296.1 hypothetical protein AWP68_14020 [Escherichia coli]
MQYKSPYNGVVNLNSSRVGEIGESKTLFTVDNYEYLSKVDILRLKIQTLNEKRKRLSESLEYMRGSYISGFLSKNEFYEKKEEIKELDVSMKEYNAELKSIRNMINLGKIEVKSRFMISDIAVNNNQYVNSGDYIMQVELLNQYLVDIKYDPVSIKGRLQDKKIKFKSLVAGISGEGKVLKISNTNSRDNSNTYGLKIASIAINSSVYDMSSLLDTAFEITIND